MTPKEEFIFAQTAVQKSFLTREQARAGLDAAAKQAMQGVSVDVAEAFVKQGLLTTDQVNQIREAMGLPAAGRKLTTIGEFQITGKLGEGGMGIVYRARQISLDREVALKILPPRLAADRSFVERFHREAKTVARLNHPNIIQVYYAGEDKGLHFMAMELVDGATTLDIVEKRGKFTEKEASKLLCEMSSALHHAHREGIIHRDIKPDNIMLTKDGVSKLADLGLAKETVSAGMTQSGAIVGTPRYMSPEQARGESKIDPRADIYSLGASVYHLVAGQAPFEGSNAMQVIMKHLNEKPAPLKSTSPQLSDAFCRVIEKMMEKEAEKRYQSAQELAADGERLLRGHPLQPHLQETQEARSASAMAQTVTPSTRAVIRGRGAAPVITEESLDFATPVPSTASVPQAMPARPPATTMPVPPVKPEALSRANYRTSLKPAPSGGEGFLRFLVVLFILALLGAGGFLYYQSYRTIQEAHETARVLAAKTPAQKAQEEFERARLANTEKPQEYAANLQRLKELPSSRFNEETKRQWEEEIARIESDARREGEDKFRKLSAAAQTLMDSREFRKADESLKGFPAALRSEHWEKQLGELKAKIRASAVQYANETLKKLQELAGKGEFGPIASLKTQIPSDDLKAFAPEQAPKIQEILENAQETLASQRLADTAIRPVVTDLYAKRTVDNGFGVFGVANKALADQDLVKILSVPPRNRLLDELKALQEIESLTYGFLQSKVGKSFEYRGIQWNVVAFKAGQIDVEKKGVGTYREKLIHEVFSIADIGKLAEMAKEDKSSDPEFQWKICILHLLAGDPEIAEAKLRDIESKLPKEHIEPYRRELEHHTDLRRRTSDMAEIPATEFPVGINDTEVDKLTEEIRTQKGGNLFELGWVRQEAPRRVVQLDPFWMDRYEVSNERYTAFLEAVSKTNDHSKCHPNEPKEKNHRPQFWDDQNVGRAKKNQPVVGVDWLDAYSFAAWEGKRLPTEAEWECAASWGPDFQAKRQYPWGDKFAPKVAQFLKLDDKGNATNEELFPLPVSGIKNGASAWDCRNMAGNVWEWVSDWYQQDYKPADDLENPKGAKQGDSKIVRGGSFKTVHLWGRTTARFAYRPDTRQIDIGFRCAADPIPLVKIRLERYGVAQ